jgi:hypothetical protein
VYCPTRNGVLPNKKWCTPQQEMVYSPTRNGVLPNKKWCTPQQEMVYCPTRNGVLPNKWVRPIFLQTSAFSDSSGALSVVVVYIVVYIFKQQGGERKMPALDE